MPKKEAIKAKITILTILPLIIHHTNQNSFPSFLLSFLSLSFYPPNSTCTSLCVVTLWSFIINFSPKRCLFICTNLASKPRRRRRSGKMEQFLDLNEKWVVKEEKTLELTLGPPGEQEWTNKNTYGYNTSVKNPILVKKTEWQQQGQFLQLQQQTAEKKVFSAAKNNNSTTAVTNNSAQKRTAPGPVVGWPPVRSFRKNLANGSNSSSSKSASESPDVVVPNKVPSQKPVENNNSTKGLFVKINMDGIPIGRKVDLKACDSYVKLSYVVDELFRGLIAAQNDTSGIDNGGKIIGGLLDGSGEYTLVYEDNEGDRMLVGDVPWNMFISTVKRLRVLKSSELPTLARGSKQGKLS